MSTISNIVRDFRKGLIEWALIAGIEVGQCFLPVPPCPASRPRVTRRGFTFYSKTYKLFQDGSKDALKEVDLPQATGPMILMLDMAAEKPRTGKRQHPRGDVDNFAKGPLDALTKAEKMFHDDDQIVGLLAFKRYTEPGEEPGITINYLEVDIDG